MAAIQAKLDKEKADHEKTKESIESQRGKATELANAKARAEKLTQEVRVVVHVRLCATMPTNWRRLRPPNEAGSGSGAGLRVKIWTYKRS